MIASRSLPDLLGGGLGAHLERAAARGYSSRGCPARPRMKPPVGKSGPGTISSDLRRAASADSGPARCVALMISVRLCGGMFVAMPTAMPVGAVDQQVRHARRQNFRLCLAVVVVGLEIDGLLVDVFEQRRRRCATGALRCTAWPPADRRRPSRSCPARRPAGSASRTAAPCGPTRRRSAESPCGWNLPMHFADDLGALARGAVEVQPHLVHAEQDAAVHRLQPVADVGQRAADDHAHRVIEIRPRISSSMLIGMRFLLSPSPPHGRRGAAIGRRRRSGRVIGVGRLGQVDSSVSRTLRAEVARVGGNCYFTTWVRGGIEMGRPGTRRAPRGVRRFARTRVR